MDIWVSAIALISEDSSEHIKRFNILWSCHSAKAQQEDIESGSLVLQGQQHMHLKSSNPTTHSPNQGFLFIIQSAA